MFTVTLPCLVQSRADARPQRAITPATAAQFSAAFMSTGLEDYSLECVEVLNGRFESTCLNILDSIAPLRLRNPKRDNEPWLNETTRALRRQCRCAERQWKKDRLLISLQALRRSLTAYQQAVKTAKSQYMSNIVSCNSHKPHVLFNVLNSIINPRVNGSTASSTTLCESFLKFFVDKVAAVRSSVSLPSNPVSAASSMCPVILETFEPITLSELAQLVRGLRPSFCPTDCLPPKLLKEVFDSVGPVVLSLINLSLASGCVPSVFKHAIVQPLLKKHNLDPNELANYRPISKLPFLSKILEKAVYDQLQSHLACYDLYEKFQSGFKPKHSTETALLRVFNDLILTVDSGDSAALLLLDMSSAFDTVDHEVLLSCLETTIGIKGFALEWFRSYLLNRTFSVHISPHQSKSAPLSSGVPQGSILGPILFAIYLLPLGSILRRYNISFHCFADDLQMYVPLRPRSPSLEHLKNCLREIKDWLSLNFLRLNEQKTEIVVFGDLSLLEGVDTVLGPLSSFSKPFVKDLGVILDSGLTMEKQISSVVKNSFFQLRLLSKVKSYLPSRDFERVMHMFITVRLDYCNSLYVGLNQASLQRLQLVQNAAARLLTGTKRHQHITPVLASLHWLPVRQRIDFKIALMVFKCLNDLAPSYLCDLMAIHKPARTLRSSSELLLEVPRTKLKKSKGQRAFSFVGPTLWNSLPPHVRAAESLEHFKSSVKTHLFSLAF